MLTRGLQEQFELLEDLWFASWRSRGQGELAPLSDMS